MRSIITRAPLLPLLTGLVLAGACAQGTPPEEELGPNPFLEEQGVGKADTGYLNLSGLEMEVTLEADVDASRYYVHDSGPYLAQYATTYLRKRHEFYLMILNEDDTAPDRVEWLVDGAWISAEEAERLPATQLTHFRMRGIDAVALNRFANELAEGQVITAKVPIRPYLVMSEVKDACADYNSHIELSQSVYWYLWNPDKSGCQVDLQDMKITIDRMMPKNPSSYPEYDRLWADNELSVAILFGKLDDDGDIKDDWNWGAADRFCQWLEDAGFVEEPDQDRKRRFVKSVGDRRELVDIYYPDQFHSVADYARYSTLQNAVNDHEVVIYLGHSVLGTGSAYDSITYPDFYQIMFIGGCLGYEYYVQPVLAGKGGWENVDAVSSILENYYHEMNAATGAFLAKLFYGFERSGNVSWQEIMGAINSRLGHAHFGVSGARGNCFGPDGHNRCTEPGPGGLRYQSTAPAEIPDNDAAGAVSVITVPDSVPVSGLALELDVSHTYVGDLLITLQHHGIEHVLWNRSGGSQRDLVQTFAVDTFAGVDAAGDWTLRVVDGASLDSGTLNRWTLDITTQQ